jgi:hypothetical protein
MIPYPVGGGGGGGIIHTVGGADRGRYMDYGGRGGIKVTQKQIVNEKTKRRKAAEKDGKSQKKTKSSAYTALKKKVQAVVRKERTKKYKQLNEEIKKMPKEKQKATRDKVKRTLMKTQKELFSKMVGKKKISVKDLQKLLNFKFRI